MDYWSLCSGLLAQSWKDWAGCLLFIKLLDVSSMQLKCLKWYVKWEIVCNIHYVVCECACIFMILSSQISAQGRTRTLLEAPVMTVLVFFLWMVSCNLFHMCLNMENLDMKAFGISIQKWGFQCVARNARRKQNWSTAGMSLKKTKDGDLQLGPMDTKDNCGDQDFRPFWAGLHKISNTFAQTIGLLPQRQFETVNCCANSLVDSCNSPSFLSMKNCVATRISSPCINVWNCTGHVISSQHHHLWVRTSLFRVRVWFELRIICAVFFFTAWYFLCTNLLWEPKSWACSVWNVWNDGIIYHGTFDGPCCYVPSGANASECKQISANAGEYKQMYANACKYEQMQATASKCKQLVANITKYNENYCKYKHMQANASKC